VKQIRQGDILLILVERQPPENLQPKQEVVLAIGETTGHAHVLAGREVYEWEIEGQRYVRVSGSLGSIAHADHDPNPVAVVEEDSTYLVVPQLEWDLQNQWRKVED
jgi:hypothetical protein